MMLQVPQPPNISICISICPSAYDPYGVARSSDKRSGHELREHCCIKTVYNHHLQIGEAADVTQVLVCHLQAATSTQ